MGKAKVLIWDCETAPSLAYVWEKYETNVLWYEREGYMLCFAYKWLGDKRNHIVALPDFKTYKKSPHDDKQLITALHGLFCEAQIIIAHNGDSFDQKIANGRYLYHNFEPPEPYKQIDTLKIARKNFRLNSNKLDDLGNFLGVGRKERTGGVDLWHDVLDGDMKAWARMKRYNRRDVDLLEAVYLKLRPWTQNHPSMNLLESRPNACPKCGGGPMQGRGIRVNKTTLYRQFQCQSCGGWCHSPIADKIIKPNYVN